MRNKIFTLLLSTSLILVLLVSVGISSLGALSGSSFKAGRIIDDAVFYNGTSMSVSSIQNFLDAKVPVCDTDGSEAYGGTTRAAYGSSKGYPPPYTCLKDYKLTTPGKAAESGLCNAVPKRSSAVSAAQVIYDVAKNCGVSPKVIIVLLQKEQSLVTDDWPWKVQYTKATGYGCPDSDLSSSVDKNNNGCYDQYEGFFKQIYYAARQYKNYRKNPDSFNFIAGEDNFIRYNPKSSCDGSNVYIQNQATAGLYNYTPYQPNAAALSNLYGTGNSCSAYGNRNFWRMYIDWFGSVYTTTEYAYWIESQEIYSNSARTLPYSGPYTEQPGGKYYARIKVRNMGNKPWGGSIVVNIGTTHPYDRASGFQDVTWLSNNRPTGMAESSVVPGEVATFEFALTAPNQTGSYREYFNIVAEGKAWMKDMGLYYNLDVVEPLVVSPTSATLSPNTTLNSGESIISPDKQSVLILQKDGNLVLYRNFKPIWNARTAGSGAQRLIMQSDGNLVLYTQADVPVWHTNTHGHTNAKLVLQADGNLVLYSSTDTALWDIGSVFNPNLLSIVNKSAKNSIIFPGQQLQTANKHFRLVLQADGNLVLYSTNRATWSSKTTGKSVSQLRMQSDGNLVLYSIKGNAIWKTNTASFKNASLVLQQDGNVVIYDTSGKPRWSSRTNGIE